MLQAEIRRSKFLIVVLINNDLPHLLCMHMLSMPPNPNMYIPNVNIESHLNLYSIFEVAVVMTRKGRC
jgi:hypothetical protein